MIDPGLVANEVKALLPREAGDGEAPADRTTPYHVLYVIPGGTLDGSWGNPHEEMDVVVQVNSVGGTREQAQLAQTEVRAALVGRTSSGYTNAIAGDGWRVTRRECDDAGVDPEPPAGLHTAIDRFTFHVVPGPAVEPDPGP